VKENEETRYLFRGLCRWGPRADEFPRGHSRRPISSALTGLANDQHQTSLGKTVKTLWKMETGLQLIVELRVTQPAASYHIIVRSRGGDSYWIHRYPIVLYLMTPPVGVETNHLFGVQYTPACRFLSVPLWIAFRRAHKHGILPARCIRLASSVSG